jgi:hypothetical protein
VAINPLRLPEYDRFTAIALMPAQLKEKLKNESFEAIFDNNGRELK